ncbi:MAG TPA: hypothetical protein VFW24_16655 [Acidimicrobiales bacterium]|nr:hypothetical protein [Acidimicrobiales bacterium]
MDDRPPQEPGQLDFGLEVPYGFRAGELVKVEGLRGSFRFVAVKRDRGGPVADVYGPLPSGGRLVGAAKLRSVDPRRLSRD